jgi:predicted nucleic acid-binding protein
VFVDSSAIIALLVKNDSNHEQAMEALSRMVRQGAELVMSNFIIAESYNLIAARVNSFKAREWLLANTWPVERVGRLDEKRALEIIRKYDDKDFSYTDATSFAMIERFAIDFAFTFDRHFQQYGIRIIA